ncbi:MAG: exo-alpha-sialidase [Caldilineaceae bacterium]
MQVKPDFLVRPDGVVLLFVTVGLGDGRPGDRFVAVYATPDNGLTWNYLSAIQPTTPDARFVNRYYASPVLLPDGRILAALRCQIDARNAWPELVTSDDGGRTWQFVTRISDWGGQRICCAWTTVVCWQAMAIGSNPMASAPSSLKTMARRGDRS